MRGCNHHRTESEDLYESANRSLIRRVPMLGVSRGTAPVMGAERGAIQSGRLVGGSERVELCEQTSLDGEEASANMTLASSTQTGTAVCVA